MIWIKMIFYDLFFDFHLDLDFHLHGTVLFACSTSGRAGMIRLRAGKLNAPQSVHQTVFLFSVDEHAEQRCADQHPHHIRQGIVDIGSASRYEVLVKFIQNPVNTP